jgi:hypothetical protein
MDEIEENISVQRNEDFATRALKGKTYRPRNVQLLTLKTRQALMSLQPKQTLIIKDIPGHELNGEDTKLDYLRTMQQKVLAFCRSRHLRIATRRMLDDETNVEQLCVVRMPDTTKEGEDQ